MNGNVRNAPDGTVEPEGLPDELVDTLFSHLTPVSSLALAVSGGADSLSLLVLFAEWTQRTGWPGRAEVLTVDHGLRPESASEADSVMGHADRCGLPGTVLRWLGSKPAGNVQEEARAARYRLMAGHMKGSGADALLLAHHLDDQAETFLDRLTRGSGVSGLGAMAADEPHGPEGLRLLRPFLGVPKARLEATLRERGHDWCRDPSNFDGKYKRSRLRRIMALLEEEGLSADRIARTAGQMRLAREALDVTVLDLASRQIGEHPAGPLKIGRDVYRVTPEDLRLRLLTYMIWRAVGLRPRIRLAKLQALDAALMADGCGRNTLAGALFETGPEHVWCWKEAGRTPPGTIDLSAAGSGKDWSGDWDSRYRYSVCDAFRSADLLQGLRFGPLCAAPVPQRNISWPEGWPRDAFACSPAVWSVKDNVLVQTASPDLRMGEGADRRVLDLARIPLKGKFTGNYVADEGEGAEI